MTYAEIIKKLEIYSDGISGMHEDFDPGLQETCVNAIDFINRQKAEIERLKTNLNVELDNFASEYDGKIKAEAYKEFAEEVNKELFGEEYQLDKAHRRAVERILNRLISKERC